MRGKLKMTLEKMHKKIIGNICCTINNCADCYDCNGYDCRPYNRVNLFEVTQNGFHIEAYDDKTNEELFEIANCCGYKATFVKEDNATMIKFYRKQLFI